MKRLILALLVAAMVTSASGCLYIRADELYRLPQASEEYLNLQEQLNAVLSSGAEFSPPTGGQNRQSVQLKDLDGDGVSEAIAFFAVPGSLKIYIFRKTEEGYAAAEIIEGAGTAIESIRYDDMDGDGVTELIVGWQMGTALRHMSIYSIRDFHSVLLAGGDYSTLTVFDLSGDGYNEVVVLRLPSAETTAAAEVFELMPDGEIVSLTTGLSEGLTKINRVLTGKLSDGVPAVFVEGEGKFDGGDYITDICAYRGGSLINVTAALPADISESAVKAVSLNCTDINKDGVMEVPVSRILMAQSETPYYAHDWYAYDSEGVSQLALTTYHNMFDEWYLILPFNWRRKVSVRREDLASGERTIIFSRIPDLGGQYEDFLKIYKLTGDKRWERARLTGRQELLSEGTAVYAFELLTEPNSFGLMFDSQLIRDNFRLIYSDWTR